MTTITASPVSVDKLLDARAEQLWTSLSNKYITMLAEEPQLSDWDDVFNGTEDLANASTIQRQHFVIQHHLAKTILSTA